MVEFEKSLKTVFKTGKVIIGSKQALNLTKAGKAKMVILSSNCPENVKKNIQNYSQISKIPVYISTFHSKDLRRICGKPFNVSAITIRDIGDSDILKLVKSDVNRD
ncbi:50S ribosomal protein L30e [Candidatus Bathyarchaeota archaeon]|nr:50S ribosomal protein L30e [Candidatus Bathyarchaeota archaeon]